MDTRRSSVESLAPVGWPLLGSLVLTGVVVAMVCVPPFSGLHTWTQVFWLACLYLLVAAAVHALAVWSIYRIQSEGVHDWTMVWPVVWGAWIAVVWLPLLALLFYERSFWVAAVVPVAAVFLTMFVVSRRREEDGNGVHWERPDGNPGMFALDDSPRLWRMLLPSLVIAIVIDGGVWAAVADHAVTAGCLFGLAAAYVAEHLLSRTVARVKVRTVCMRRASAGNSVAVWMLTVVALLPFLAGMGMAIRGLMGMPAVQAAKSGGRSAVRSSWGFSGIILTLPRKPHVVVTPLLASAHVDGINRSRMIPFDGTYWYFKSPDTRPRPSARVVPGNPLKNTIRSTDSMPVVMEAHQRLAQEMEMSCCQALQVNIVNADAIPGAIAMEVVLRDSDGKVMKSMSLGSKVLPSSTVSPMPLHRRPVQETLHFQIPRSAKNSRFDEITVKIKPERSRSLAGPHVSIESFMLER